MPNAGGLTDREAAIDAIIRFVCSLDNGESELCVSAFTEDVVVTLNFCKTDMHYDPSIRRDDVVDVMMKKVGKPLDTNHSTADICCTVTGNSAELTTCVLAQPFQGGEGPSPEFQRSYFFGSHYKTTLVRAGELWRVSTL
ncbi:hypothetical protein PV08_11071 [Exophiala spinifera]|uniref:SnoaL-like domain-containing protein n=1 Tax=Exophiala spinifera TaxID=91928 RepID=A0A0D1Y5A7_9EURO|nr:uncharacterized protein PV08_11071 [Exophiala spinifera]KIW10111.1 hypothetical protein PV08_11071 [Exophiala spinifera]